MKNFNALLFEKIIEHFFVRYLGINYIFWNRMIKIIGIDLCHFVF